MRKLIFAAIFLVVLLAGSTAFAFSQGDIASLGAKPSDPVEPYDFIVNSSLINGTIYYYAFGNTGRLDYGGPLNIGSATGTCANCVINAALAGLPDYGGIVFMQTGFYVISAPLVMKSGAAFNPTLVRF